MATPLCRSSEILFRSLCHHRYVSAVFIQRGKFTATKWSFVGMNTMENSKCRPNQKYTYGKARFRWRTSKYRDGVLLSQTKCWHCAVQDDNIITKRHWFYQKACRICCSILPFLSSVNMRNVTFILFSCIQYTINIIYMYVYEMWRTN